MSSSILPPFKFRPILKQAPWGGERIIPFKHLSSHLDRVGESWEVSDVEGDESIVDGGPFDGLTLPALVSQFRERLVGRKVYASQGNHFPLLIKFIDACQDLSIQVHPDDQLARQRGSRCGKTEMWYIVDAPKDAFLLSGFNQPLSREEYLKRSADGSICDVIQKHHVQEGDCFFIPAGQVHAICTGIFLIEIQQTSDITYRIYDYNRLGIDGQPRQLHIQESLDAIDFTPRVSEKTAYDYQPNRRNEMVRCPYFTTSVYGLTASTDIPLKDRDSFTILIAYQGRFQLRLDNQEPVFVEAGQSVLIPAEAELASILPGTGGCKFVETHID